MANTYPYVASAGPLLSTIRQLRKSFPAVVNSETLKKLSLAPNNESYVLNVLRFLRVIDEDGKKTDASQTFNKPDDDFAEEFEKLVRDAYGQLFDLHPDAWSLEKEKLVAFFRTSDDSTQTVGTRQAGTFQTLAALSGHDAPVRERGKRANGTKPEKRKKRGSGGSSPLQPAPDPSKSVGLTVRIEVNLPATNEQDIYDKIFRSIRENLINA